MFWCKLHRWNTFIVNSLDHKTNVQIEGECWRLPHRFYFQLRKCRAGNAPLLCTDAQTKVRFVFLAPCMFLRSCASKRSDSIRTDGSRHLVSEDSGSHHKDGKHAQFVSVKFLSPLLCAHDQICICDKSVCRLANSHLNSIFVSAEVMVLLLHSLLNQNDSCIYTELTVY